MKSDFQINHGLMVLRCTGEPSDIVHFVAYENEPTQADADALREELRNDEEFGLTEADDLIITPAPPEVLEHFRHEHDDERIETTTGGSLPATCHHPLSWVDVVFWIVLSLLPILVILYCFAQSQVESIYQP